MSSVLVSGSCSYAYCCCRCCFSFLALQFGLAIALQTLHQTCLYCWCCCCHSLHPACYAVEAVKQLLMLHYTRALLLASAAQTLRLHFPGDLHLRSDRALGTPPQRSLNRNQASKRQPLPDTAPAGRLHHRLQLHRKLQHHDWAMAERASLAHAWAGWPWQRQQTRQWHRQKALSKEEVLAAWVPAS